MLGRYHVLDEIGRNAVGPLYLARLEGPKGFQRWASIRRVDKKHAAEEGYVQRFFERVRAGAKLLHPNVAALFDVDEEDGTPWVAMEYLHGERIETAIERLEIADTPASWEIAARIIADAAQGVQAVHELRDREGAPLGLMHGDLAPHSIVVTYEGKTKLKGAFEPRVHGVLDPRKIAYAAPEQLFEGDPIDARADVFALGAILWELLAGKRLFARSSEDETRAMIEAGVVPPLAEVVEDVPTELDAIVRRALARSPSSRFSSARELSRELESLLVRKGVVARDDDVGRYMRTLFADRYNDQEARLQAASDVTEIWRRSQQSPIARALAVASLPDVSAKDEEEDAPVEATELMRQPFSDEEDRTTAERPAVKPLSGYTDEVPADSGPTIPRTRIPVAAMHDTDEIPTMTAPQQTLVPKTKPRPLRQMDRQRRRHADRAAGSGRQRAVSAHHAVLAPQRRRGDRERDLRRAAHSEHDPGGHVAAPSISAAPARAELSGSSAPSVDAERRRGFHGAAHERHVAASAADARAAHDGRDAAARVPANSASAVARAGVARAPQRALDDLAPRGALPARSRQAHVRRVDRRADRRRGAVLHVLRDLARDGSLRADARAFERRVDEADRRHAHAALGERHERRALGHGHAAPRRSADPDLRSLDTAADHAAPRRHHAHDRAATGHDGDERLEQQDRIPHGLVPPDRVRSHRRRRPRSRRISPVSPGALGGEACPHASRRQLARLEGSDRRRTRRRDRHHPPRLSMTTPLLAGKYRLERVIGQGGMGVVVSATHVMLNERVAIKLLLPEALENAETVARFQREARAAVRIKSEHVARVSDVGVVDAPASALQPVIGVPLAPGAPFMVMEYLEGQDLAGVLRATGPLPLADAVGYLAQAIEAIAEAHALGIVHRDLKPSNLFLTHRPDGTPLVKVLDFGISKAATGNAMEAAMTTTSAVLGSPMYMAPEQMIASREVDGRTDVWALGVVLYQLLAGHGPFNGTTMTELCARILQEPHAPIRASRPDVPVEIDAVISRCLEKDRVRRFPSVADLAEAIAPWGGQLASLSAERARRLIPRTERVSGAPIVPQTNPSAYAVYGTPQPAMPYAATNPSWSATRQGSGSSSGVWVALALGAAAIIVAAAIVILIVAARMHSPSAQAGPAQTAPEAPIPTAPAMTTPAVELAPLHAHETATAAGQAPPVHTLNRPPAPPPTATTHVVPTQNQPPHATAAQPPPDIF